MGWISLKSGGMQSMINLILPVILLTMIPKMPKENKYDKSSFQEAVYHILKEEGGLVNDKNDKGGITNYGISIKFLNGVIRENPEMIKEFDLLHTNRIDAYDIKHMTKREAEHIYKKLWWDKYNYGKIDYQPLSNKIFELSVNIGPLSASNLLTKACYAVKRKSFKPTSEMNITIINYINSLPEDEKEEIMNKLKIFAIQYYMGIIKKNPSQVKYKRGWINRVES